MSDLALYLLHSGRSDSLEGQCVHFIMRLAGCEEVTLTSQGGDQPAIVYASTGACIATGLVDIVYWLSYRNFHSAELLQSLCGATKEERRCIARGLKKVLTWTSDWSDTATDAVVQLSHPLCEAVLFDKMIWHKNMKHFLDSPHTQGGAIPRLTAADVLLVTLLQPWLAAFAQEKEAILATIPAVVMYAKRIRSELQDIEGMRPDTAGAGSSRQFSVTGELWVDLVANQLEARKPFKFTQKPGVKGEQKGAAMVAGDVNVGVADAELVDSTAQELIGRVTWLDASEMGGSDDLDTAAAVSSECRVPGPYSLEDPLWRHMSLPAGRQVRKAEQIASLLRHAQRLLPPGGVAVEFCSGGGYVGIPLAYLRPDCTVLLTDMNSVSLKFAEQRVAVLGLRNVHFLRAELSHLEAFARGESSVAGVEHGGAVQRLLKSFQVGLALHACGPASDAVLRICRVRGASCVVSPCCYGFIQHATGNMVPAGIADGAGLAEEPCPCVGACGDSFCTDCCEAQDKTAATAETPLLAADSAACRAVYPQSAAFREAGWQAAWFAALCARADRTFWSHDSRAQTHNTAGRLAMRVVDADRLLCMQEAGYEVYGAFMKPLEASVKNHILVCQKVLPGDVN